MNPTDNKPTDIIKKLNSTSPLDDFKPANEIFHAHLPDTLFMNHYQLHDEWRHITPDEWRRFLLDNDRFILKETAMITEANARGALQRLSSGKLNSGDAAAIAQLLKQSEQINQQAKDKTQFITMFMPDPKDRELLDFNRTAVYQRNRDNVNAFYTPDFLKARVDRGEVFLNTDGTIHIINPNTYSAALDKAYMTLFNPENKKVIELEADEGCDWQ